MMKTIAIILLFTAVSSQAAEPAAPSGRRGERDRPAHLVRHKLAELILEPRTNTPEQFDSGAVECPMVVRWADRWLMFYTGIRWVDGTADSTIGVAISDDMIQWNDRRQALPRGDDGSFDHGGVSGPFVWAEGDRLRMIFIGFPNPGYEKGPGRHGLATSADGLEWTQADFNPIHGPGPNGTWNDGTVYKTFILPYGGIYWMFYNAFGSPDKCEQIGLATSPDLRTWIEHPDNPLLRKGNPATDRDQKIIGDPWIMKRDDTWEMFYFAFDGEHARECLATSPNLVNWRKSPLNPIMDVGPDGTYDDRYCHKPCIILHEGVYYHFYTAVEEREDGKHYRAIALATSKKLDGATYRNESPAASAGRQSPEREKP